MLRKALLIFSGNAFGSLMLLLRNLIIARIVSVEDYGIAATFAISMAIVEMASGLGLQQLLVQDKDGDKPELQAGLQGFNVLRSLISAAVLFFLAQPIAQFLGIPDIAWAYQVLAIVPLLRGFEHFDIHRLNRAMRFGPLIVTKTIPSALSVLSIWPLYFWYGDYRVMLYSVILHWVLTLATGHLVAERPYRLSFERAYLKKGFHFGWPLLVNNIILFLVFQGDKLLVGRELGMEDLAIFAMGVTFTLTPSLVSAASEQQFFLPQLSENRETPARFTSLALTSMQTSLVLGMGLVASITLFAAPLVTFLLGPKYEPLIEILPWLAIWQALRAFKVGNTVVALSLAQTSNAMFANGLRTLFLPISWYILVQNGDLLHIIWIAIAGEVAAYLLSLTMVARRAQLSITPMILPLLLALSSFAVIACATIYTGMGSILSILLACSFMLGSLTFMHHFRHYLKDRHSLHKS